MKIPPNSPSQPPPGGSPVQPNAPANSVSRAFSRLKQIIGSAGSAVQPMTPQQLTEQIMRAIDEGNNTALKVLLAYPNVNYNLIGVNGETPLTHATKSGKEEAVAQLLTFAGNNPKTLNPNAKNKEGDAPLHLVETPEIAKLLLAHPKTDPNLPGSQSFEGRTPLHSAISNGKPGIARELLSHPDVDPNKFDIKKEPPLYAAVDNGQEEILKLLLAHSRTDPNLGEGYTRDTPLCLAITKGKVDLVKLLLSSKKINPNQRGSDRQTPLYMAIDASNAVIVRELLSHANTDPNEVDFDNRTPLDAARLKGNDDIIEQLRAHPKTEIDLPISHPQFDPNKKNNFGETRLHIAIEKGDTDLVRMLLAHDKIDPNQPNGIGYAPIHVAVQKGDVETVGLLLAHPLIDPNVNSHTRGTPLHAAIFREEIFSLLLAHPDIDPQRGSENGESLLFLSIWHEKPELERLLLAHPKCDRDYAKAFVRGIRRMIQLGAPLKPEFIERMKQHVPAGPLSKIMVQIQRNLIHQAVMDDSSIDQTLLNAMKGYIHSDFFMINDLHDAGFQNIFKLFLSRGINLEGNRPVSHELRAFIKELGSHKKMFNRLSYALVSNPNIPLTQESVQRLAAIHDLDPASDKLLIAIQGGATLEEIERVFSLLGQIPPDSLADWQQLGYEEQQLWLNYCVVFKSRRGLLFAEKILKSTANNLQEGRPLHITEIELALSALRLIERIETISHDRPEDRALLSEFENTVSVLLLHGLTRSFYSADTVSGHMRLLKQTFSTLASIDTVHNRQRNLPALMHALDIFTENRDADTIGERADGICGLLQSLRRYSRFEEMLQDHPNWAQMILNLASTSESVEPAAVKHKLLFELGLTMSLIPHPEILKKAYRIVQGETWDHLSAGEAGVLDRETGNFELIAYRPSKHDLRENISDRILDMLAAQLYVDPQAEDLYRSFCDAPERYPDVDKYERNLRETPMWNLRYMEPLYLPKEAPLFRGINARKGEGLLNEALFDLLKRGSGSTELMEVKAHSGTWAKIGQMFTSLTSDYVMKGYFSEGGVLMVINPDWVNEQIRIRQARNAAETGAFHYVFYHTIPLEAMREIYLPEETFLKVQALYAMPKFSKAELKKSGIALPATPAEERDLFLLYRAIREQGKDLIPKLKTYQSVDEVNRLIPKSADFVEDVVPENVKRFIRRKLAKQWLEHGLKSKI